MIWLSEKGKNYVLNEERMRKKITQMDGEIMLCQVRNQQSNLIGDFVSDNPTKTKEIINKRKRGLITNEEWNKWKKEVKIRKLTPRECLKLMGFSDDFKIVVSNTQAYRQAGNSIVVNIFEHLIQNILKELKPKEKPQEISVLKKYEKKYVLYF